MTGNRITGRTLYTLFLFFFYFHRKTSEFFRMYNITNLYENIYRRHFTLNTAYYNIDSNKMRQIQSFWEICGCYILLYYLKFFIRVSYKSIWFQKISTSLKKSSHSSRKFSLPCHCYSLTFQNQTVFVRAGRVWNRFFLNFF